MQANQSHDFQRWSHSIAAVAFDMDGLMVNTETIYTEVGDEILKRRGKRFTPELKRKMMGLPGQVAFQVMIEHESLTDSVEILAMESSALFADLLPAKIRTLPGVCDLLDHLEEKNLPRCVATSSSPDFAERVLQLIGLRTRFEFVITAHDVENGKPAPDIYIAAAQRLGVPVAQMLVLEDSQHGAQAGCASGACTIAVPGEHSMDHDFRGVHAIAQSLQDGRIYSLLS